MANAQWAVFPNNWRNGMQSIPYVLTGGMGLGLFGYAQTVARELRQRGIPCCVDMIQDSQKKGDSHVH